MADIIKLLGNVFNVVTFMGLWVIWVLGLGLQQWQYWRLGYI
ncbi:MULTISPECIES: hypothetical protein [Kamptonema]|nr:MULTISPECIES: hypothetical protein [Kamptonema]CBN56697.1 hypothetical protein OSCI_3150001 [Kamptonema sp. PCC 6506]